MTNGEAPMRRGMWSENLGRDENEMERRRCRGNGCEERDQIGSDEPAGDDERRRAGEDGCHQMLQRQHRALPQIACLRLCEQPRGVRAGRDREQRSDDRQAARRSIADEVSEEMDSQHDAESGQDHRSAHDPAPPLRPGKDHVETRWMLEISDEQNERDRQEECGE